MSGAGKGWRRMREGGRAVCSLLYLCRHGETASWEMEPGQETPLEAST